MYTFTTPGPAMRQHSVSSSPYADAQTSLAPALLVKVKLGRGAEVTPSPYSNVHRQSQSEQCLMMSV